MRQAYYGLLLLFIPLLYTGCGMQKKTSLTHTAYHDLTARYNRYFNSKLILQETYASFEDNHEDDYNQLLPLYIYGTEQQAQSAYPDLDEVIKKASANIKLHENSKWTDDAYFHIGECHYLKRDYDEALKAFIYITSEFDKGVRMEPRKKHKSKSRSREEAEKERNTNQYYEKGLSFTKHKPARWEAMVWIIKCYTQLEEYSKAQSIIAYAHGDKKFPEQLKEDLAVAVTFYHIQQKQYNQAATSIQRAITYADKKKDALRYLFIQAQLYELAGVKNLAIEKYNAVLEGNPSDEMEFYAKLKIARISKEENIYSNEYLISLLNSMLKNGKYEDFHAEIYYTLAEVYESEKNSEKAIENYNKAIQNSEANSSQLAKAYAKLAELYFQEERYPISQRYHDSTLVAMSPGDPRYDEFNTRNNILKDLVRYMETIAAQDSLQHLGSLSEKELEEYLKKQQKKEKETNEQEENENFEPLIGPNNNQQATNWPFDNPSQKSQGYNIFKQQWGDRPHVDNWRRNEVASLQFSENNQNTEENEEDINKGEEGGEIVTGEIPSTPEEIEASNKLIAEAYYRIGNIYKNKLNNTPKAIETFEELMARFPQNQYRMETAYYLYLLYTERGLMAKADQYKQIILQEYPESILAKVLIDPNYLEKQRAKENEVTNYYASTYDFFVRDDLQTTLQRKHQADSIFPNNVLKPKFDMLEALVYGKMGLIDSYKVHLQAVVNKYPFDEVKPKAVAMLNALEGKEYNKGNAGANKFLYEPEKQHMLVILFDTITPEVEQFKVHLAQFNDEYYSLAGLNITTALLNTETQLVLVKSFNNAEKAKAYYNSMRYNTDLFKGFDQEIYRVFYISDKNYGIFYREKDLAGYMQFFTQKYLQGE